MTQSNGEEKHPGPETYDLKSSGALRKTVFLYLIHCQKCQSIKKMNDRTVKSPEELMESIIIVLPKKTIYRLEAHAKKLGLSPSAIVKGALSGYFSNEVA